MFTKHMQTTWASALMWCSKELVHSPSIFSFSSCRKDMLVGCSLRKKCCDLFFYHQAICTYAQSGSVVLSCPSFECLFWWKFSCHWWLCMFLLLTEDLPTNQTPPPTRPPSLLLIIASCLAEQPETNNSFHCWDDEMSLQGEENYLETAVWTSSRVKMKIE